MDYGSARLAIFGLLLVVVVLFVSLLITKSIYHKTTGIE